MEATRSLSEFWRIDRSSDRVMELVSVLQGGDSLIGIMGSGVRAVWSTNGQSETWWVRTKEGKPIESRVFLDYSPLRDISSPFNGRAVDEVIGYAAHEGGHCLWSDSKGKETIIQIMSRSATAKTGEAVKDKRKVEEVLRVANILEDAYIDFHVGQEWPVLGEYIRWSRQKIADRRPIDLDTIARGTRPARNSVLNLWIACSLYDAELPQRMSARIRRAMNFLMGKSVKAVQTEDARLRMRLAVECWEYLVKEFPTDEEPLPRQQPPPQPQAEKPEEEDTDQGEGEGGGKGEKGQDEGEGGGKGEKGQDEEDTTVPDEGDEGGLGDGGGGKSVAGEDKREGQKEEQSQQGGDEAGSPGNLDEFDIRDIDEIPEEVLQNVLEAMAHELEDLSQSVAEVVSRPVGDVMAQTKKADYDGPAAERVRSLVEKQIQEMQRVFDHQAAVKSRHLKGLTTGKLDGRSLARVGTGNVRVFKRREVLEQPDLAVGLLLDVSGSMASHMDVVWMTAAVFGESLVRKKGVNFLGLTYTGGYFEVQTTRICDREMGRLCLGNVDQGGGTPSGPALASMKVLMDRMPERQKVIIHFTDGMPDEAFSVRTVVDRCRKAGYTVWVIGVRGYEQALQAQYGDGNWETIASIAELPAKVGSLVTRVIASRVGEYAGRSGTLAST